MSTHPKLRQMMMMVPSRWFASLILTSFVLLITQVAGAQSFNRVEFAKHVQPLIESSLLDNTTVLFGSNLGNANAHDPSNLPIFLAGGGYKHGRYIAHDRKNNTPLCNLYVNMLNKMNIETGSFATNSGELTW